MKSPLIAGKFYRNSQSTNLYRKGQWGQTSAFLTRIPPGSLIYIVKEEAEWTSRYLVIVNELIGTIQFYVNTSPIAYTIVLPDP